MKVNDFGESSKVDEVSLSGYYFHASLFLAEELYFPQRSNLVSLLSGLSCILNDIT